MEQTLVSEDNLIANISKLTIFDQFAQTIFVEEPQGYIEIENSYRESNTIKFIRTEIAYQLKNHRVISKKLNDNNIVVSDLIDNSTISVDKSICRCVSSDLNNLLIQELSSFKTEFEEYNLFSQNLFRTIFYKSTPKKFIDKFLKISKDMSWAIVPYNLLHIFYDSKEINLSSHTDEKIIYHLGKIQNTEIYINPDDKSGKIFMGNFDSVLILANKEMNIIETPQGTNYNFQYLFIKQGPIKCLQVK